MIDPNPHDLKYDFHPVADGDNSHAHQLRAVPVGSNVLEVGCATGYVSRLLTTSRNCRVTGIELLPAAAERARAECVRVVVGDIERIDLEAEFGAERFDAIVLGDVLEHLVDPAAVLVRLRDYLAPAGRIVATVPNVAHGDLRLALLDGRFDYQPLGLLDETHLRFFTHKSLFVTFERAGYTITTLDRIKAPLFGTELGVHPGMFPPELVAFVARDPEATTYQFVVVAVVAAEVPSPETLTPEAALLEAKQAVAALLTRQDALAHQLHAMTADRDLHVHNLGLSVAREAALVAEARGLREQALASQAAAEQLLAAEQTAAAARYATLEAHYSELIQRFQRMRRASIFNPWVVLPALYRRLMRP